MPEDIVVKSPNGYGKMTLSNAQFGPQGSLEYFDIALDLPGVSGAISIYAYAPGGCTLARYFESLAESWRGWQGTKDFESIEGDLRIEATIDRAGHVRLDITLCCDPRDWRLRAAIHAESGQLARLANQMSSFYQPHAQ